MRLRWDATPAKKVSGDSGFTLLECLAALVVVGIATSIFISLLSASITLAKLSRSQSVAASLAEERMAEVIHSPSKYLWPDYEAMPVGKLHALMRVDDPNTPGHIAEPPLAMPTNKKSYNRERSFYRDFSVETRARVSERDANYVQVIVLVRWVLSGRDHVLTITSCVPRSVGEGLA